MAGVFVPAVICIAVATAVIWLLVSRSVEQALTALGGKVQATADGLVIQGVETLSGGLAQGVNDHRVVMALAAAALGSRRPVTVTDAWSIRKSYPKFFTDFESLGGKAHVV